MVLKLYKMDASPPSRAVMMTIKAANIPDVEIIDVNMQERDHLKDEYVKVSEIFIYIYQTAVTLSKSGHTPLTK